MSDNIDAPAGRESPARAPLPPSRANKKPVTCWVSRETHRRLRLLALERDASNQEILSAALAQYLDDAEAGRHSA
ncbi:MAG: ribbon-helix-helix domain-containing protein [Pseudomonadota bacterium]